MAPRLPSQILRLAHRVPRTGPAMLAALCLAAPLAFGQEPAPTKWEQLFYPFPIVGAPPQLEQQLQLFGTGFTGDGGHGEVMQGELGYIATSHLGLVLTVPYQFGQGGQPSGWEDLNLLVQWLAAGSLRHDWMLSAGLSTTFPTGSSGLTQRVPVLGPFAYAAERFAGHLILEENLTLGVPTNGDTTTRVIGGGLLSVLLTHENSSFPVYVQGEIGSTTNVGVIQVTASMPAEREQVFAGPELFLGPFHSPISDGTRVATGVLFDVRGLPQESRTYTLTVAFDIPNRFGY